MALLPQRQSGLLPKPRTQLLPLDMGASVRAEAEGHQQRFGAPQGGYIPFPTMPTKEQIGQWALQNPLDAAALATSPVPVVGDVVGFAADAKALYDDPSWSNAGWLAAGLLPFVPAGTVKRVVGGAEDVAKATRKVDDLTGLPLNPDGTVTLYHATPTKEAADIIRRTGVLKSAGEPDVYMSTARSGTGYGDYVVEINVDPKRIEIDDEFPDGRKDFRMSVGKPGGSVTVGIPTDEASRMARAEQGALPLGDTPDPEGARMRRAQKMGYNTDLELYRGTTAKGEKEVPQSFEAGAGVFTSTNPDVAEVFRYPREYGESVTEVFDDAIGDFVPVEPGDIQKVYARMQNPLVLRGDEAQAFTNDTAMQSRMIKDAIKRGKDSIILEDVVEGVGDNVHRGTTVVALKPIRSTNAKFDLNKADSADLMAGIAGGLLGIGAYNRLSAEEEY